MTRNHVKCPRIRNVPDGFHRVLVVELPAAAVRMAGKSRGARGPGRSFPVGTHAERSTAGAAAAVLRSGVDLARPERDLRAWGASRA